MKTPTAKGYRRFSSGIPRQQAVLFATCLDDAIEADNEVRLIDAFVDSLKLEEFGFKLDQVENGRPAYHPATLLKLFIYGYLNRIRSSRQLEKECKRNIEVMRPAPGGYSIVCSLTTIARRTVRLLTSGKKTLKRSRKCFVPP